MRGLAAAVCFCCGMVAAAAAAGGETQRVYACETQVLEADCGEGRVLRVLRGNYGRTSISPCNEHVRVDWDIRCGEPSSEALLKERCDGRRRCEVVSSNYIFGEPCEGTGKYLEMEFRCEPDPQPPTTPAELLTLEAEGAGAALLYCNTHDLRRLDLDTDQERVLLRDLDRSVVVDYDYGRDLLVWTDSKAKSILSASLSDGGGRRVLAENVTSYGVAVDWSNGLLYWTDSGSDVIDVCRLDDCGGARTTLFDDMLDEPRGIVLDPAQGFVYWIDWGEVPKIEKSGMDGSGRRVIVSSGLKWPNGIAIDLSGRRLYWIEAFHENLCSSDLEGRDVRKIIPHSPFLKLPFSIDVFQEWVYWTEWTSNKENIFKADKSDGGNITRVLDGETTLMGIKVLHADKQPAVAPSCGEDDCSHLCLASPCFNFSCACPPGKVLLPDGRNCSASSGSDLSLLYCNRHDIRKYDMMTQEDSQVLDGLRRATVLDFHFQKGVLLWTDTDLKKIYSAPAAGGEEPKREVVDSVVSYGIAVDWMHDHLYWTDTLNDRLEVADLDGTRRKALFVTNLDEPRAIVLNPSHGWMFWSDWGSVPKIERSGMDGTHRRVIVSRDIRWPNGLAFDLESGLLYWVDGKLNVLCVVDADGANRRTLISGSSLMRHPFSLDIFGEWLYWVEWSSGKESLYRARKEDGGRASKVFDGERSLMGVKVWNDSRQPHPGAADVCGNCSHLCLPAPSLDGPTDNFTCACPDDDAACAGTAPPSITAPDLMDNSTGVLLCANVDDIRVVNLRTFEDSVLVADLTRAVAVDFLYANKTVFWTDIREDRICSSPMSGGGLVTELVSDCSHADGLAVDWIHLNMYWTDKGKDSIGVARLDGSWEKTLFDRDLDEPRAIALDPFAGWMFWTDWGRVPKIERAGMDGERRTVAISRNVQWPNGLALDLDARRIYWADAKTHEICSARYDGGDRKTVLMSWSLLKQPFSLDIWREDMYWVEWRSGEESIYRADKRTGGNATKVLEGRRWKNLMGIRVFHPSRQPPGEGRCGGAGCSHLCLPAPDSNRSCACPNGLVLAYNGRDCLVEAEVTTETDLPLFSPSSTDAEHAILLYANKIDVRRLDLQTKEDNALADNFTRASGIDFHYAEKLAVFTDYERGHIYSVPLWSGSPVTRLLSNVSSNGVAVDWLHSHIYWTDNVRNSIDVARMDGRVRRTLFKGDGVDQPRTIVLHPGDGWMFWTDWGRVPKIERAGLDGSNREAIVETGVDWTHALAIDLDLRKIYWANSDSKKILSVNYDGSGSRVVLHSVDLLHLPFSMDVLQDDLYWTEFLPMHETIYRTNKQSGQGTARVHDRSWARLMSIKIFHSSKQPQGSSRCVAHRCSHLCLPTPLLPTVRSNYSCACPNGMLLDTDGATCLSEDALWTEEPPTLQPFSLAPDVNLSQVMNEKSATGLPVGAIVGVLSALILVALLSVFAYHRHFLRRNMGNMVFNNRSTEGTRRRTSASTSSPPEGAWCP